VDAFDRSFDVEPIYFPSDCRSLPKRAYKGILMRGPRGGNDLRQRFRTSAQALLVGDRVWKLPQRQAWRLDRRVMLISLNL
jgi:hypothetical protein